MQLVPARQPILTNMKLFCYLLFGFLVALNVHGQNCPRLDVQSFFTSITFGDRISPALAVCANQLNKDNAPYSSFLRIEYDSLQQACRKKYADLFTFLSVHFSFSQISTNPKGQILSVERYSFFNEHKATDSITGSPLTSFVSLYQKLESLYGKPTQFELPMKTDSLLMKEKGMQQTATWSCSTIDITLRVYYGAPHKELNVLHVIIRNRDLDIPEVDQYLQ